MSIRIASALKSVMETKGYGCPWFVDSPPLYDSNGDVIEQFYGVIQDGQGTSPRRRGDARDKTLNELGQIDLYQPNATENYLFYYQLWNDLDGLKLPTAPKQVVRLQVQSANRLPPMVEDPVVRYTYSLMFVRLK